jgi:hypothetical protein
MPKHVVLYMLMQGRSVAGVGQVSDGDQEDDMPAACSRDTFYVDTDKNVPIIAMSPDGK